MREPFDLQGYRRFSAAKTAFEVLSAKMGEPWFHTFQRRREDLAAQGKVAPKKRLATSEEAFLRLAFAQGLGAIESLTMPYFAYHEPAQRFWGPPLGRRDRPTDAALLTHWVPGTAKRCGAALVGITALGERWFYAEVPRRT
ncbi:MAG: hypothetical protein J7M05_09295, partial [Anaerolineae bacterium]|nr:hypothetical protein [Anaerolineae bacterium]